jgi:hypothetical protein
MEYKNRSVRDFQLGYEGDDPAKSVPAIQSWVENGDAMMIEMRDLRLRWVREALNAGYPHKVLIRWGVPRTVILEAGKGRRRGQAQAEGGLPRDDRPPVSLVDDQPPSPMGF